MPLNGAGDFGTASVQQQGDEMEKRRKNQVPGWVRRAGRVREWMSLIKEVAANWSHDELVRAFACEYCDRRRLQDEYNEFRAKVFGRLSHKEMWFNLSCDIEPVPCRFCGGRGPSLGIVKSGLGDFAVECDCTVRGPSGITPRRAIELWNKMQKGIGNG